MANLSKAHEVLEKAFAEFRKRQTLARGKVSIEEFANELGYKQPTVNQWLNKDRPIGENALIKIAPKIAELLGNEIYKTLGLPMPDESKIELDEIWDNLPEDKKGELLKVAKKLSKK
jgi:transcriptional regulator with XRE-family HTH domain